MSVKYGFIGCGNMGGALVRASAKEIDAKDILIADSFKEKVDGFAGSLGVIASTTREIAEKADYIFLGVKPQMMADMLSEIKDVLAKRTGFVLVTMAAGLSMEKIEAMAGGKYPIIRIMPNLPANVGKGMILYTANGLVSDKNVDEFKKAMKSAGLIDRIDEKLIDAASAITGCGPAFVAMMIEALADGGVECGLPRAKALCYAEQTVLGTAGYLLETETHPAVLKDAVCSPGGTTIEGVMTLEEGGFRATAMDAVVAAYEKTKALGK